MAIDCSASTPQTTIGIEGGIIWPSGPTAVASAAAKSRRYPLRSNSSIMTEPTAAVVAGADPEIAPKKVPATTVAMLSPPVRTPKTAEARRTSRFDRPPALIRSPARMKPGTARRLLTSVPANMRCAKMTGFISAI